MTKVDIYRNLHKDCFSVRSREYPDRGKVIDHGNLYLVTDVEFAVQSSGRQKVLETKRKNVHAFVRGFLVHMIPEWIINELKGSASSALIEVTYNPYKSSSFQEVSTGRPIKRASWAILENGKIFALVG